MQLAVRDPLRLALREAASAFVLVHNHPSGDPTPSAEDLRFTERVAEAAEILGTPLVDHLIVAGDRYRSLLDDGFFAPLSRRRARAAPVRRAGDSSPT